MSNLAKRRRSHLSTNPLTTTVIEDTPASGHTSNTGFPVSGGCTHNDRWIGSRLDELEGAPVTSSTSNPKGLGSAEPIATYGRGTHRTTFCDGSTRDTRPAPRHTNKTPQSLSRGRKGFDRTRKMKTPTRPTPMQCLHRRDKYNPWSTVGLTVICSLCLLERCSLCHKSMSGGDYNRHQSSTCPNR